MGFNNGSAEAREVESLSFAAWNFEGRERMG